MSATRLLNLIVAYLKRLLLLPDQVAEAKTLAAKLLIHQMKASAPVTHLHQAEFKVFSQFGDDGIIQYLIHRTGITNCEQCFVEFGVESYEESNTRFLLTNDNWKGVVIDGDPRNIRHIQYDRISWRHDLRALCAFIDRDNINGLIKSAGMSGDIGLLSIDIDGNDYWVWERIECVNPVIVVVEYNSVFGWEHAVSVPYDPRFQRGAAHYSHLYWGCSIAALERLAKKKGYALVGSNSAGNNAYFVRRDRLSGIRELTAQEAYVESKFRESRDQSGRLTFLAGAQRIHAIRDLSLCEVERNEMVRIADLS
ncbi:MAG: hypothetical protein ACOYXR_06845 [Nitrospirota bacterium]